MSETQIKTATEIEVLLSASEIADRVKSLAETLNSHYRPILAHGERLVLVGVLKGALVFLADLIRALDFPVQLEFVRLASYGDSQESGELQVPDLALPNITARHVLVVEDIVDTGKTASFLLAYLEGQFQPSSLKMAALLDKPSRRLKDVKADFVAFTIEDLFVVGYGLDFAERYRELPFLGVLIC